MWLTSATTSGSRVQQTCWIRLITPLSTKSLSWKGTPVSTGLPACSTRTPLLTIRRKSTAPRALGPTSSTPGSSPDSVASVRAHGKPWRWRCWATACRRHAVAQQRHLQGFPWALTEATLSGELPGVEEVGPSARGAVDFLRIVSKGVRVEHAGNPVLTGVPFQDRLSVDNGVIKRLQQVC